MVRLIRRSGSHTPRVVTSIALALSMTLPASAQTPGPTADRVEARYWEAYEAYLESSPEALGRALRLWSQSAVLSERLGNTRYHAAAVRAIALVYRAQGQPDSMQRYNRLADAAQFGPPTEEETPVLAPALGLGASVGYYALGGGVAGPIGAARGLDVFLQFTAPSGLGLRGGARASHHHIGDGREPYVLFGLFLEPRFVVQSVASKLAPFVGVRAGRVWESVSDPGVSFRATGYFAGGSGGVLIRLHQQLAFETGLGFGGIWFGDFDFDGEATWEACVRPHRETNTPLPLVVHDCSGSSFHPGRPQVPPSPGRFLGSGLRVRVAHPGTARNGSWFRVWFGLNLSLSTH